MLLLGTTDTLYEGDPAEVAATDADVDLVLARGSRGGRRRPAAAGPRALDLRRPAGAAARATARPSTPGARRRSCAGEGGMLTVAGGKLTTYRHIALDALGRLSLRARPRPPRPPAGAAPGGDGRRERRGAPRHAAWHARARGRRPSRPLLRLAGRPRRRLAAERPELLERLHAGRAGHRRPGRLRRPRGMGDEADDVRPPAHDPGARGASRLGRRRTVVARDRRCSERAEHDWIRAVQATTEEADDGDGRGTADVHPPGRQGEGDGHRSLHGRPRPRRPARSRSSATPTTPTRGSPGSTRARRARCPACSPSSPTRTSRTCSTAAWSRTGGSSPGTPSASRATSWPASRRRRRRSPSRPLR